jgi:peptidyl-prolyl cis-trans isomerase C
MSKISTSIALLLAGGMVLAGVFAAAQQGADPVLAKVDGVEIRQSDLALAEADIGSNLPPSAGEARRDALLSYLIDITILARAAEAKKFASEPGFDRRLAHARRKVLMEVLLERESKAAASEAEMKKLYDDSVKKMTPEQEVHARHILVESEEKAKEVIAKLKAGGDFTALAKEFSKDAGASEGGDLGFFAKDQMVPEFAEAAFKLGKGELSAPVKTQFGWHVIKVEDKRERPVPAYEQIKDQIEAYIVRRAQTDLVMKLRGAAKIERLIQKDEKPAQAPASPGNQKK